VTERGSRERQRRGERRDGRRRQGTGQRGDGGDFCVSFFSPRFLSLFLCLFLSRSLFVSLVLFFLLFPFLFLFLCVCVCVFVRGFLILHQRFQNGGCHDGRRSRTFGFDRGGRRFRQHFDIDAKGFVIRAGTVSRR